MNVAEAIVVEGAQGVGEYTRQYFEEDIVDKESRCSYDLLAIEARSYLHIDYIDVVDKLLLIEDILVADSHYLELVVENRDKLRMESGFDHIEP